jgi:uncharacterized protein YjbI with pentapeptide repeats
MNASTLRKRWQTPEGRAMAEEAIARLAARSSLDGMGLPIYEGRLDLRGLPAPIPTRLRRFQSQGWSVEVLDDLLVLRDAKIEGVDFSGARLPSVRFFSSVIANCRFQGANCQDWRLWATTVQDTDFDRASLRGAAVGTWHEGKRNSWYRVNFSRADFRVGVCLEAIFSECDFADAKIVSVDFSQCSFTTCRFAGIIRNVLFDGRDLSPERPQSTQMSKVDFRSALFDNVDFRGFDLKDVRLPDDSDILLIQRARCAARRGIHLLSGDDRLPARMLRADLENRLRGPGTDQEALIFNSRDYEKSGGRELADLAKHILRRAELECRK